MVKKKLNAYFGNDGIEFHIDPTVTGAAQTIPPIDILSLDTVENLYTDEWGLLQNN